MSYIPTDAAIDIVKKIANTRNSMGDPILLALVNGQLTPPVTVPPTSQDAWDAILAAYNISNNTFPWDSVLEPLTKTFSTTQDLGTALITGNNSWQDVPNSSWSVAPASPRPMTLIASLSGAATGSLAGASPIPYRVTFAGNIIAQSQFPTQSGSVFVALPPLRGIATPVYPLVPQLVKFQVAPVVNLNWITSTDCNVSYSLI